jgi:hypothetical protein
LYNNIPDWIKIAEIKNMIPRGKDPPLDTQTEPMTKHHSRKTDKLINTSCNTAVSHRQESFFSMDTYMTMMMALILHMTKKSLKERQNHQIKTEELNSPIAHRHSPTICSRT